MYKKNQNYNDSGRRNLWIIGIEDKEETQVKDAENIFNKIREKKDIPAQKKRDVYHSLREIKNANGQDMKKNGGSVVKRMPYFCKGLKFNSSTYMVSYNYL